MDKGEESEYNLDSGYQNNNKQNNIINLLQESQNQQNIGELSIKQNQALPMPKKAIKKSNYTTSKKKKIRQEMNLFKDLRGNKSLQVCSYTNINKFPLYFNLSTQKTFYLAGGFVVELANYCKLNNDNYYNSSKAIEKVKKFNNGSITVDIISSEVDHNFQKVIKILQSTQNQEDYDLSLKLIGFSQPALLLKLTIEKVIQQYQPTHLVNIIQHRKIYIDKLAEQYSQQILKDDDFGQSISYSIDWDLKSMVNKHFFISQPTIALLGTTTDEYISYIMRKTFLLFFTPQSNKRVVDYSINFSTTTQKKENSILFKDIEIKMMDDLVISCDCEFHVKFVEYPHQLQFNEQDFEILNSTDCITVVKYILTKEHLEKIIKIRQQFISNFSQQKLNLLDDRNDFVINNFEYYLQSSIFLDKFYSKVSNQCSQDENSIKMCNFRSICD